jgi:LmbE family N-acetylglucosaminyl deacetylase
MIDRVVVSPHLDDAALSASAMLDEHAAVVNVFTGAPLRDGALSLWDKVCGETDSGDVARRRVAEDARALATRGIEPVNLGYRDALIRKADGDTSEIEVAALAGDLDDALRTSPLPPEGQVWVPLGGGPRPHGDHVLVREAALILHRLGYWRVGLYADQPYVYKSRAWPAFIQPSREGIPTAPAVDDPSWWRRFPRAVPEMFALDHRMIVAHPDPEAKLALMEMYETQFENLNRRLRTKNLLRDPALYGIEVYWMLDLPARIEAAA